MQEENKFDPKQIWAEFHKKYYQLPKNIEHLNLYKKRLSAEEKVSFTHKFESEHKKLVKSALIIQQWWKKKTTRDTLIPVNLNGNHSEEFKELVHKQSVKKSINTIKLTQLYQAIQKADWGDEIFIDSHLPYLTLSLFASGKISQQQVNSILEFWQILNENYNNIAVTAAMDEKFKLTESFLKVLAEIVDPFFFKELDEEQIEQLKSLIFELPPSERYFFRFDIDQYEREFNDLEDKDQLKDITKHSLGFQLMKIGGLYHSMEDYPNEGEFNLRAIYFSAGIRDALGIVRFGLRNYIRMVPTFGEKTPHEIEKGVRQKKRYGALRYPDIKPYGKVHDFAQVTDIEAISHDYYHAGVMASLGEEIQNTFLVFIDCIRETIYPDIKPKSPQQEAHTLETWDLTDEELPLCYYDSEQYNDSDFRENRNSEAKITNTFVDTLVMGVKSFYRNYLLELNKNEHSQRNITLLGIILIFKFLDHPEKWRKNKINFETFSESKLHSDVKDSPTFKKHYQKIAVLNKSMKFEPVRIKILKTLLFQSFKNQPDGQAAFGLFSKLVSENKDVVLEKLKFGRITDKDIKEEKLLKTQKNTIYFAYDQQKISTDPDKNIPLIKKITGDLTKIQLKN